jgi:uncharacterized Zn-binding protein involved in type VI secretion
MASLGCARIGDKCGGYYISTYSKNLFVDGRPAGSLGSIVSGHGLPPHTPNPIVTSSKTVFSGGIPLARLTDSASCGHKTSTASTSVRIG